MTSTTTTTTQQKITLSGRVVLEKSVPPRKRATDDAILTGSATSPTTTTTAKRGRMSPPSELDESSADLTQLLATRRRNIDEPQGSAALGAVTATEHDNDETKETDRSAVTKKVRYFSNFYRQPEPGEVFVGGRPVQTGSEVGGDQTPKLVDWMTDSQFHLLPPNSSFPLSWTMQRHWMDAIQRVHHYALPDLSTRALWNGY